MIYGASYAPEALKAICQAFDQAWAQIAHQFGDNQAVVEAARLRLAEAVLEIAHLQPPAPEWRHQKPLKKNERLKDRVEKDLAKIKSSPRLVRSFFRAESVGYITD